MPTSNHAVSTADADADKPHHKPGTPPPARRAWPVNEAAYLLGISRVSIYAMAKRGELALVRVAGRTLVLESEIARLTTPQAQAGAA